MSDALASAEKLIFLPLYFFGKAFTLYVRPRREILDNFDIKSEDGYSRLHACLGPPVWILTSHMHLLAIVSNVLTENNGNSQHLVCRARGSERQC